MHLSYTSRHYKTMNARRQIKTTYQGILDYVRLNLLQLSWCCTIVLVVLSVDLVYCLSITRRRFEVVFGLVASTDRYETVTSRPLPGSEVAGVVQLLFSERPESLGWLRFPSLPSRVVEVLKCTWSALCSAVASATEFSANAHQRFVKIGVLRHGADSV